MQMQKVERKTPQVFVVFEYSDSEGVYEAIEAFKDKEGAMIAAIANPMNRFIEVFTLQ